MTSPLVRSRGPSRRPRWSGSSAIRLSSTSEDRAHRPFRACVWFLMLGFVPRDIFCVSGCSRSNEYVEFPISLVAATALHVSMMASLTMPGLGLAHVAGSEDVCSEMMVDLLRRTDFERTNPHPTRLWRRCPPPGGVWGSCLLPADLRGRPAAALILLPGRGRDEAGTRRNSRGYEQSHGQTRRYPVSNRSDERRCSSRGDLVALSRLGLAAPSLQDRQKGRGGSRSGSTESSLMTSDGEDESRKKDAADEFFSFGENGKFMGLAAPSIQTRQAGADGPPDSFRLNLEQRLNLTRNSWKIRSETTVDSKTIFARMMGSRPGAPCTAELPARGMSPQDQPFDQADFDALFRDSRPLEGDESQLG